MYALTLLVTRPIVGKLTERCGFVKVAVPAVLMTVASLTMIAYANSTWMLLAAALVNAFGYGAVQPIFATRSNCINLWIVLMKVISCAKRQKAKDLLPLFHKKRIKKRHESMTKKGISNETKSSATSFA